MKPRRFNEKPLGVKARHAGAPSMIELFDIVPGFYLACRYDDAYFGAWKKQSEANIPPVRMHSP